MTDMIVVHEHPEIPSKTKITEAQLDLLRRIVKTNGGGLPFWRENHGTVRGLINRHLIEAKRGNGSYMVHTRAGLDFIRNLSNRGEP